MYPEGEICHLKITHAGGIVAEKTIVAYNEALKGVDIYMVSFFIFNLRQNSVLYIYWQIKKNSNTIYQSLNLSTSSKGYFLSITSG